MFPAQRSFYKMVETKPEIQHSPAIDNVHANVNANIFEGAYDPSSRNITSSDYTRLSYNGSGVRSGIDSAWPPPLSVADDSGNILTNASDITRSTTERKPGEQPVKPVETADVQPTQRGENVVDGGVTTKPPVKPEDPAQTTTEQPAEKPAEKPAEVQPDKPVDQSLPPELQQEAEKIKNLTGPQKLLVETAFKAVGQPLWAESKYANLTVDGRYGCAASETVLKHRAGYDYVDSPLVSGVVNNLLKNGWTKHPFDERQPGDTVVRHKAGQKWKNGGGDAHIGTVGADINYAYNNNSDSGTWSYKPINESFSPRHKRFVLRPPEGETLVAKGR
jgi:hypothetical protein